MKKKQPELRPTDGELEILRILWKLGPSSVGQVHKLHHAMKGTTYNTTLKLMLIMNDKGLLKRDESVRPQIYSVSIPENQLKQSLVRDLLHRAFEGSTKNFVAALTATNLSKAERAEIRRLLDEEDKR